MLFRKRKFYNRAPRYEVNWPARANQMGRVSFVTIKNISVGGVLLTIPRMTHFLEDLPTKITVQFRGSTLELSGRLVHYTFDEHDQCFGVQFGHLPPDTQARLEKWLEVLRKDPSLANAGFSAFLKVFMQWLWSQIRGSKG